MDKAHAARSHNDRELKLHKVHWATVLQAVAAQREDKALSAVQKVVRGWPLGKRDNFLMPRVITLGQVASQGTQEARDAAQSCVASIKERNRSGLLSR